MKKITTLIGCLLFATAGFAQQQEPEQTPQEKQEQRIQNLEKAVKKSQKLKVSGYIQTQYQWGEKAAGLKVGAGNENSEKSFNRIGIRRGRIKFQYDEGLATGVFQLDLTDKTLSENKQYVSFKDVYLSVKDPWIGTNSLKAGIFDRPFGFEISYSSSRRESPERSTVFQTLFPDERELGAQLTLQAAKASPLNFLKLEAGLFAGNGIRQETDNRRDFIGHLSANKSIGPNVKFGLGVSYYNGSVYQSTANVYRMKGKGFELNDNANNKGRFARREYFGVDGQFSIMSGAGQTQIRGEFLTGTQPGVKGNSKSPNSSSRPSEADTYVRNFNGGYAILVQDFGTLPLSAVVKYDWYDPNTKVSKNDIGIDGTGTGAADIAYNTLGAGLLWRANNAISVTAYYEFVKNEKTENLTAFAKDLKDDVFTLRLQYKF